MRMRHKVLTIPFMATGTEINGGDRQADDARLQEILGMLRARGGRVTTPRRAIITALLRSGGHITADQLTNEIQANYPDIHLSTIYRCLETLEELEVVDHIHMGHGRAVYHLADEKHQHLMCEVCGAVTEVPDAVFAGLAGTLRRKYSFAIKPRHFAVLGRCETCLEAPRSAGGRS
ncbi:MAG: Fur family transcriptional regulator, ferric uptake regulator, partial [Actinomycetota bacterium]|nr:Fur family transcriptional regulator, ferric uptake regulator [Actinomycetota bacterium]